MHWNCTTRTTCEMMIFRERVLSHSPSGTGVASHHAHSNSSVRTIEQDEMRFVCLRAYFAVMVFFRSAIVNEYNLILSLCENIIFFTHKHTHTEDISITMPIFLSPLSLSYSLCRCVCVMRHSGSTN